jgi:hypothetical protein
VSKDSVSSLCDISLTTTTLFCSAHSERNLGNGTRRKEQDTNLGSSGWLGHSLGIGKDTGIGIGQPHHYIISWRDRKVLFGSIGPLDVCVWSGSLKSEGFEARYAPRFRECVLIDFLNVDDVVMWRWGFIFDGCC